MSNMKTSSGTKVSSGMNRQSLPGMIRDLLTTGDPQSRRQNAAWLRTLVDAYGPPSSAAPAPPLSIDAISELIYVATGVWAEDADIATALQTTAGIFGEVA